MNPTRINNYNSFKKANIFVWCNVYDEILKTLSSIKEFDLTDQDFYYLGDLYTNYFYTKDTIYIFLYLPNAAPPATFIRCPVMPSSQNGVDLLLNLHDAALPPNPFAYPGNSSPRRSCFRVQLPQRRFAFLDD